MYETNSEAPGSEAPSSESVESEQGYDNTPKESYDYWSEELDTSEKARKPWWKKSDKIVNAYLGKSTATQTDETLLRLNLFHSNTTTLSDMLYGSTPKIDVSRRYAQANDDDGRVAAEIMERLLNIDVAERSAETDSVFKAALQDRLLCGLGCVKARYVVETEEVPIPGAFNEDGTQAVDERVTFEDAPIDYYYWGDILWGWCRTWADMPWIAFRSYMSKEEVSNRWGKLAAEGLEFKKQTRKTGDEGADNPEENDSAWLRAEVWEIWCKETRKVHWISQGYNVQLEEKPDLLGLANFWPVPPFLLANPTTSLYKPTPDFTLAEDLYNEIDTLQTRIGVLTEAVKVVGVYNASASNINTMFDAGMDNQLIPVENWALFSENGGLAGQIEWVPIEAVTTALGELIMLRDSTIQLLQQTTGMTDVMRGSLDNQYEGVGQTQEKAKYGSVRIQALQEQFALFAGGAMQIKAEIISRHFSPETIYKRANMEFSADEEYIQSAIELIKNPEASRIRVAIRPESIAMVDHNAVKSERTEYLNAVSTYMQSSQGIIEADPAAKPFVLQLLQWGLAGFKGASEIEGVIDKAIEASQKAAEKEANNPEPDPAQAAAQAASALEQMKQQGAIKTIEAKTRSTLQIRQSDMRADIQTQHETHIRKMAEIQAGLKAKIAETRVSLQADLLMEKAQADSNILQTQATVEGEIQKDVVEAEIDVASEQGKTANKINEIAASAMADIQKNQVAAALAPEPAEKKDD
jgi:hypothetical protein